MFIGRYLLVDDSSLLLVAPDASGALSHGVVTQVWRCYAWRCYALLRRCANRYLSERRSLHLLALGHTPSLYLSLCPPLCF